MARKQYSIGSTRRAYRKINGKKKVVNVTKLPGGKEKVSIVDSIPMSKDTRNIVNIGQQIKSGDMEDSRDESEILGDIIQTTSLEESDGPESGKIASTIKKAMRKAPMVKGLEKVGESASGVKVVDVMVDGSALGVATRKDLSKLEKAKRIGVQVIALPIPGGAGVAVSQIYYAKKDQKAKKLKEGKS